MPILEFFLSLELYHYLIMGGGVALYLFVFLLTQNIKTSSLILLCGYGGFNLFVDLGSFWLAHLYFLLATWIIAFFLAFFCSLDFRGSTYKRAILLAKGKKNVIENVFEGILVSGAAGSGKTQSVIYPLIKHYAKYNFAGILYDYKDFELTEIAYPQFQKAKVKFKCICFHDITRTSRINPIAPAYIENEDSLTSFFQTLYENIFGNNKSANLFFKTAAISSVSALCWKLHKDDPKNCNLPFLAALLTQKLIHEIASLISSNLRARSIGSTLIDSLASPETSANIKASLSSFMTFFLSPEKFYVLSEDELNLELNNPASPTVLSFVNQPSHQKAYSPIISSIIGIALKKMSKRAQRPSFLLLDEAPTLKLQDISQIPATMRSFEMSTLYSMQDKSLSDEMQGATTTRAILANLSSMYIGRANDEHTARMYQELSQLIKEKQTSLSQSSNWLSAKSEDRISTSEREKAGMHKSQFFKFKTGEFYNFSNGKEQKLNFPYHEPLKQMPEIKNHITPRELEERYIATLEIAKAYKIKDNQKNDLNDLATPNELGLATQELTTELTPNL